MSSNGYHVRLGGSEWLAWDAAVLRTTGFEACGLEVLSDPELAAVADAHLRGDADRDAYVDAFAGAVARNSGTLQAVVTDPRALAAVAWQSQSSLEGFLAMARHGDGGPRNNDRRRREKLAMRYWQRYCAKTDTIGFFGPFAWATVGGAAVTEQRPGPAVVRRAFVAFEDWALDGFGAWLRDQPELRPWLVPARHPHHAVEDGLLLRPSRRALPLSPADESLLRACTGARHASAVADELVRQRPDLHPSVQAVLGSLADLADRKLITWDANLPISEDAEDRLVALLAAIEDDDARAKATSAWSSLTEPRDALAAAWDDHVTLADSLGTLAERFEDLTGQAAQRRGGQMYAGRSLVYLDTERDLDVVLGTDFVDRVAVPLDAVLRTARWLVGAIRDRFDAYLAEVVGSATGTDVRLQDVWYQVIGSFSEDDPGIFAGVVDDFRRRWLRLIGTHDGAAVRLRGDEVLAAVDTLFADPSPAWAMSSIHAPDLQIATGGVGDPAARAFQVVLGELHVALPTMCGTPFDWGRATTDETVDRVSLEQGGRVVPVLPRTWPHHTVRSVFKAGRHDTLLAFAPAPGVDLDRTVAAIGVRVRTDGERVVGVLPGGDSRDLAEFFGHFLSGFASGVFKMIPGDAGFPRVTVDDVVLFRRSWACVVDSDLYRTAPEPEVYLRARAWQHDNRLPDRVFVKLRSETKPFHVDFTSPASVASFVAFAKSAAAREDADVMRLAVSEALPDLGLAPFVDGRGGRYLGEVRLHVSDGRVSGASA